MTKGFLLDTSIVSMLAPGRNDATPELVAWLRAHNDQLHTSSIVVFEISQGVAKLVRTGSQRKAASLGSWLQSHIDDFGDRVLALDVESAHMAGVIADAALSIGKHPGLADVLIAAIAKVHDLTLLTRNVRHFGPLGIDVVDPLVSLPD